LFFKFYLFTPSNALLRLIIFISRSWFCLVSSARFYLFFLALLKEYVKRLYSINNSLFLVLLKKMRLKYINLIAQCNIKAGRSLLNFLYGLVGPAVQLLEGFHVLLQSLNNFLRSSLFHSTALQSIGKRFLIFYYKLLCIFTYPCGYHANNILLIFSILFSALGACFVREFGFECIVYVLENIYSTVSWFFYFILPLFIKGGFEQDAAILPSTTQQTIIYIL